MKLKTFLYAFGASLALALPASAQCYAEYRAQQSNPVRFHVGVAAVSDNACSNSSLAAGELSDRLQQNGWTLVNVRSTFGPEGLEQRRYNAGQYYLRY